MARWHKALTVKDSAGNFGALAETIRGAPARFKVMVGNGGILYPSLLMGATGAILGVGVQAVLPRVLKPFMVVQVPFSLEPTAILAGLATGVWVAGIFALIPLLGVRDVAPLQALRHDYEPPRRRLDWRRALAYLLLAGSLVALSVWQAPNLRTGLAFAVALTVVGLILWLIALALVHGTRRFFPEHARYVIRQGISNLFRPHNQTAAVTLSLGFGIFLVATLYLVHGAIIDRITIGTGGERANLLMFDIQPGQVQGVRQILAARRVTLGDVTPIVPTRISAINGHSVAEIMASLPQGNPEGREGERRALDDGGRRHAVHPHRRRELERQALGGPDQRRLGGGVDALPVAGVHAHPRSARHGDDVSATTSWASRWSMNRAWNRAQSAKS